MGAAAEGCMRAAYLLGGAPRASQQKNESKRTRALHTEAIVAHSPLAVHVFFASLALLTSSPPAGLLLPLPLAPARWRPSDAVWERTGSALRLEMNELREPVAPAAAAVVGIKVAAPRAAAADLLLDESRERATAA